MLGFCVLWGSRWAHTENERDKPLALLFAKSPSAAAHVFEICRFVAAFFDIFEMGNGHCDGPFAQELFGGTVRLGRPKRVSQVRRGSHHPRFLDGLQASRHVSNLRPTRKA